MDFDRMPNKSQFYHLIGSNSNHQSQAAFLTSPYYSQSNPSIYGFANESFTGAADALSGSMNVSSSSSSTSVSSSYSPPFVLNTSSPLSSTSTSLTHAQSQQQQLLQQASSSSTTSTTTPPLSSCSSASSTSSNANLSSPFDYYSSRFNPANYSFLSSPISQYAHTHPQHHQLLDNSSFYHQTAKTLGYNHNGSNLKFLNTHPHQLQQTVLNSSSASFSNNKTNNTIGYEVTSKQEAVSVDMMNMINKCHKNTSNSTSTKQASSLGNFEELVRNYNTNAAEMCAVSDEILKNKPKITQSLMSLEGK
jgi:hypothetical protein